MINEFAEEALSTRLVLIRAAPSLSLALPSRRICGRAGLEAAAVSISDYYAFSRRVAKKRPLRREKDGIIRMCSELGILYRERFL